MKDLDLSIFPSVSKEEWYKLAEGQLRGEKPKEKLLWKNTSDIVLEPYYDKSDLDTLAYLTDFFSNLPNHRWKLYEQVLVKDEAAANQSALAALMGGCDGVIFRTDKSLDSGLLLKDIDSSICDISLMGNISVPEELQKTTGFLATKKENNCLQTSKNEDPISQLREIASGLTEQSFILRQGFPDFFLEIATLRALRYLTRSHEKLHIHTHIGSHESAEKQWFLNTTSGLASILGGTHSIDFTTAGGDPRISRNTGNLIREESGIESYNDPCGGTYYIEVLTDKLIREVEEKK